MDIYFSEKYTNPFPWPGYAKSEAVVPPYIWLPFLWFQSFLINYGPNFIK